MTTYRRRLACGIISWALPAILICGLAHGQAPADEPPVAVPGVAGGGSNVGAGEQAAFWSGPQEDFRKLDDGRIVGPWWQGGGPAVVYFTGKHAQRHRSFVQVGQKTAEQVGRGYVEIQKEHLWPSEDDSNGILLYPDGTARVRLMLMPGGNSFYNMCEVAKISEPTAEAARAERAKFVEARKMPQAAFSTGMNYVGACGGFFTATSGFDIPRALYAGWGFWPGKVGNIGPSIRRPLPDVVFDESQADHPLYKATDGGVLKGMYYNGGPLGVVGSVEDTQYFGRYSGGAMQELEGDWFLVVYQRHDNLLSGRCVITTGHPEAYHADFLQAMATHALDREYEVPRRLIEPGTAVAGVSGDDQVQYYCLPVEAGRKLTITLTVLDANCDLYVRADLPPTFARHDAKSTGPDRADERVVVESTGAAEYFIAVHGRHSLLNGAGYTLRVELE